MPKRLPRQADAAPTGPTSDDPLRDALERIAGVASFLRRMPDVKRRALAERLYAAIRLIQAETARPVLYKGPRPGEDEERWERATDERWERLKAVYERETKKTIELLMGQPGHETPGQKSARLRRAQRILRDQDDAFSFAAQIDAGLTTEEAREELDIGARRAERLRAVAVLMGLLEPRQRGPRPRNTRSRVPGSKR